RRSSWQCWPLHPPPCLILYCAAEENGASFTKWAAARGACRMRIYTRTGDGGDTALFSGARVGKDASRVEAYGTVDEANSFIGLLRAEGLDADIDGVLEQVQRDLFTLGADLATPPG